MTILAYHAVDAGWRHPLSVSPARFAEQCAWLAANRAIVPLSEYLRHSPHAGVALTFDDGFVSAFEAIRDHLIPLRLPATMFVVSGAFGADAHWVRDASRPVMDVEQLRELRRLGVTIGSHTHMHADLTSLDDTACMRDLRESREQLEDLLEARVPWLAYPGGRYDDRVRRCARRAGFSAAFAMAHRHGPRHDPMAIPRFGAYEHDGPWSLALKSGPVYRRVRGSRLVHRLRTVRA